MLQFGRWRVVLLTMAVAFAVMACGGQPTLSAEQWAWCSNVDHMVREVRDEASALGLRPPVNDGGITDYALYWATYYYRTNKLKELRVQPDFVRACSVTYANTH
ncbi:MAG: hypothetical protein HY263_06865 [Chloroflexi bacterium]|nr:hypothetical protein [Chloroflexota bacterium]